MNIRNFSIIAHIDHGKSTLADRLLEITGVVSQRESRAQILDGMDLERERGITIKAKTARMPYTAADGQGYVLNLIDTPGHVDFTYEVSRSLAACEGTLLVVDASQGVEAQTLANYTLAQQAGLAIIPIINKIDLPSADVEGTKKQIIEALGLTQEPVLTSAKSGVGAKEVLEAIVRYVPPPSGDAARPLAALLFDSHVDPYRGSMMYIRVLDGVIRKGQKILMMATGGLHEVEEVGRFQIRPVPTEALCAGEVGYLFAGIKDLSEIKIGDTLTDPARPTAKAHPGYKDLKPVVFAGLYPISNTDYEVLSQALGKLQLNDPSFQYFPETSMALGFGYRCGFLGLLHMDIIRERLEREFGLSLITTSPSVVYLVTGEDGEPREIDNPAKLPDAGKIRGIAEPFIHATVICPAEYVGPAMALCQDRRGVFLDMRYITTTRVILSYELPLAEIVLDFYDALKSVSRGYASFDYEPVGYRTSDLVRLDILLNQEPVDALSFIVHRDKAEYQGRRLVERLREVIPRQMFDVPIQARINSRVVARETVKAIRKDVLAKCYGGDITRKMKLLERQKEGKARLKQIGTVEIPKEAFMAVLRVGKESH